MRAILALCFLFLAGCGGFETVDDPPESTVLMYGYLDMEDAPVDLDYFNVRQLHPETDKPYWWFAIDDGYLRISGPPPGRYIFSEFGGQNCLLIFCGTQHRFIYRSEDEGFRIRRPGLHFIGAWRYRHIDRGFFRADKFDLEPLKSPTELEVLQKILPHYEKDRWRPHLEARIRTLAAQADRR